MSPSPKWTSVVDCIISLWFGIAHLPSNKYRNTVSSFGILCKNFELASRVRSM